MPEGTAINYAMEHWFKPVLAFALALVGFNIKSARNEVNALNDKVNAFPKEYMDKEDYRESMRGVHLVMAKIETNIETQRKENRADKKAQLDEIKGLHRRFDDFKKDSQ